MSINETKAGALLENFRDRQNNVEKDESIDGIIKELAQSLFDGDIDISEMVNFKEKMWKEYEVQSEHYKTVICIKRYCYDFEIKTKYLRDDWKMLLMEKLIEATMVSIFDLFLTYKPEEKEWSFNTDHGDSWKCERDILKDFFDQWEEYPVSQYKKLTNSIRDNLIKINNDELDLSDYGKHISPESGSDMIFDSDKGVSVHGGFYTKYSSFDWRHTVMSNLISDMIQEITLKVSKYKETAKFSDKIRSENPKEHIQEIINDYCKKELDTLFRVIRKSMTKTYDEY